MLYMMGQQAAAMMAPTVLIFGCTRSAIANDWRPINGRGQWTIAIVMSSSPVEPAR
jgi:hypothetical protein